MADLIIITLSVDDPALGHLLAETMTKARCHGPFPRYVKLRVVYGLGMPGTFSPPSTS